MFFYKGELHIIPLSEAQEQDCDPSAASPTISQVLRLLSSRSEEFLAAEPIRTALYKRISGYVGVLFWSSATVSFDSGLSGALSCRLTNVGIKFLLAGYIFIYVYILNRHFRC